jgi:hypothetical protein
MRFARVPENMIEADMSLVAFKVLVAILLHADRQGQCHPSNGHLASLTNLCHRSIQKGIAELVGAGLLTSEGQTSRRILTVHLAHDGARALAHDRALDEVQLAHGCSPTSAPLCASASAPLCAPIEQTIRTDQEQKERDSPLPLIPVPHDPLATQADRLADAEITRRWGEDGVQIYRQAQSLGVGLAWMLPAVEACHTSKGRYVPTYVAGIVRGYRAEGGPPAPPVAGTVKRKPLDPFEAAKEERAAKILAYREANRK